jgi:hypothetical protein
MPWARDATPRPHPAGDHHGLPREEHVGGAQDPVHGGLAGAVAIVEEMLGVGVIDRDHGKRQHAFLLHGAEPDHPRGGLFGATDDVLE